MRIEPCVNTREKVILELRRALKEGRLSSSQAATLRGQLGWAATLAFGRIGRIGMHTLKERQYSIDKSSGLTDELRSALKFLLQFHYRLPPRDVLVMGRPRRPLLVYSDAPYEPLSGTPPPPQTWVGHNRL